MFVSWLKEILQAERMLRHVVELIRWPQKDSDILVAVNFQFQGQTVRAHDRKK